MNRHSEDNERKPVYDPEQSISEPHRILVSVLMVLGLSNGIIPRAAQEFVLPVYHTTRHIKPATCLLVFVE